MHVFRCVAIACLSICPNTALHSRQVGSDKHVRADDPAQITDAVMITDITVAGQSINCGLFVQPPAVIQPVTSFQAGESWLQTMSISLINRTSKVIAAGGITLQFLETGDCRSQPCAAVEMHFGKLPAVDAYDGKTGQPLKPENSPQNPLNWAPDQKIVIHVRDYMEEVSRSLSAHLSVTSVNSVAVHLGAFFFDDGMRWAGPGYSLPDKNQPGKFRYIPIGYFPGKKNHNWPPGYDR